MNVLEELGRDPVSGRQLYLIALAEPVDLASVQLPNPYFACLVAWDAETSPVSDIAGIASQLIKKGASYVCCWGSGCERVHDIFDEIDLVSENGSPEGQALVTTWHAEEPLSEAIWFLLNNSIPDEYAAETTVSNLAVSIGSPAFATEIREAFSDVGKLDRHGPRCLPSDQ